MLDYAKLSCLRNVQQPLAVRQTGDQRGGLLDRFIWYFDASLPIADIFAFTDGLHAAFGDKVGYATTDLVRPYGVVSARLLLGSTEIIDVKHMLPPTRYPGTAEVRLVTSYCGDLLVGVSAHFQLHGDEVPRTDADGLQDIEGVIRLSVPSKYEVLAVLDVGGTASMENIGQSCSHITERLGVLLEPLQEPVKLDVMNPVPT